MAIYLIEYASPFLPELASQQVHAADARDAIRRAAQKLISQHMPLTARVRVVDPPLPGASYYCVTENGNILGAKDADFIDALLDRPRILDFEVHIQGLFEAKRKSTRPALIIAAVDEKQAAVRGRAIAGFYKLPCNVTVRRLFPDGDRGEPWQYISGGKDHTRLSRYPKPGGKRRL